MIGGPFVKVDFGTTVVTRFNKCSTELLMLNIK